MDEKILKNEINKNRNRFMGTIWKYIDGKKSFKCGASYIGNNCFLSAAHCIYKIDRKNIRIHAGSSDLLKPKYVFEIKKIIIHPKFESKKLNNDIALIFIKKDIRNSEFIPLSIPNKNMRKECYRIGHQMCVIGHGNDDLKDKKKILRYIKSIIVKVLPFKGIYVRQKILTDNKFQANNYKNGKITDACHGDSGGPAIRKINNKLYQIGIVSWGYDSKDNSYPGVYTRVMNYHDWIKKFLEIS